MVKYQCPRCHYSTSHRTNLKTHLNRKKPCENKFDTINSIEIIRDRFKGNVKHFIISDNKEKIPDSEFHTNSHKFTQIHTNSHKNPSISLNFPQFPSKSVNFTQNNVNSEKLECEFCQKEFTRKDNLDRHYLKCKYIDKNDDNLMKMENKLLKEQLQKFEDREKRWAEREIKLRNEIEKLLEKVGNVTNITNQQNIYINSHGHENLEYISASYMSKLLKIPFGALPKLIKHIHFNPDHPENHNIKITNKKLPYASVWEGDKWTVKDKKEVIANMVDKGFNILDEHYDNNGKNDLSDNQDNRYTDFKSKFQSGDKKLTKNVVKETEITILNQGR